MIVGDCFEGDVVGVAWAQHDVYGTALGVLLRECQNLVAFAHVIAEPGRSVPRDSPSVDHRTVQMAHDLIAAAWRFRSRPAEPRLPLGDGMHDPLGDPVRPMDAWLRWLRLEVRSWINEPRLVKLFWSIIENQNTPPDMLPKTR